MRPKFSAIQGRYFPTSVKTVYRSFPQPPPSTAELRPQETRPTRDQPWLAPSWATRGPPESPWQPPLLFTVVFPAHSCFRLILKGKYGRSARLSLKLNNWEAVIGSSSDGLTHISGALRV